MNLILGLVLVGAEQWKTNPLCTPSGAVRVTTLTATRVAGTFSFIESGDSTAEPPLRQVANGKFDVKVF